MRIALGIEYNGSNYHGWQKQVKLITIQAQVEQALTSVANHPVTVTCAGRTDVGVHALGQVIHFDTTVKRKSSAWILGGNSNLSPDICIRWAKEVTDDFHARFSAVARQYRYLIYNHKIRSALFADRTAWHIAPLDVSFMQQASQYLIGEHDFSSFRGCDCQSKSPMRNVHFVKVNTYKHLIIIDIKANAFLLHMVRNIVGLLMTIGEKKREPIWAKEVLQACDRRVAGVTAPASGLYLMRVYYDNQQHNLV